MDIFELRKGVWNERRAGYDEYAAEDIVAEISVLFLHDMPDTVSELTRQKISQKLSLPSCFWHRSYRHLNGAFGSSTSVDDAGTPLEHRMWFRFLIKKVLSAAYHSQYHDYQWYELGFFVNWYRKGYLMLLCVDVPPKLSNRIKTSLGSREPQNLLRDPYFLCCALVQEIADLHDDSVWAITEVARNIEKERNPGNANEVEDFPGLHDIARHAIHSVETLETAIENISSMMAKHQNLFASNVLFLQIDEDFHFRRAMLKALQCRADSTLKRIQNEIGLAFNMVAQRDSRTTLLLTKATTADSRAMRQIAVMTTIFLPATFVSSLFSTIFFDISDTGPQQDKLSTSGKFWVYWVVTIPLSIVVFGALTAMHRYQSTSKSKSKIA